MNIDTNVHDPKGESHCILPISVRNNLNKLSSLKPNQEFVEDGLLKS